jgi:hypothetical protein
MLTAASAGDDYTTYLKRITMNLSSSSGLPSLILSYNVENWVLGI